MPRKRSDVLDGVLAAAVATAPVPAGQMTEEEGRALLQRLLALPPDELRRRHKELIEDAPRTPEQEAHLAWLRTQSCEDLIALHRIGLRGEPGESERFVQELKRRERQRAEAVSSP